MITEQIITYIKDQITRGVTHDKIRSNLTAAGWEEADINQAFSFAEPNGQSATLKIAPSFAVENEVEKEESIDKSDIIKNEQEFTPILKRDPVIEPALKPIRNYDEKKDSAEQPKADPKKYELASSILVTKRPSEVINNFGDDGEIKKPKASSILKNFALLLFIALVIGNAFLWLFYFPKIDQQNINKMNALQKENSTVVQNTRDIVNPNEGEPSLDGSAYGVVIDPKTGKPTTDTSPVALLRSSTVALKTAATAYFSKHNTYGAVPMSLASCGVSGSVFVDPTVKDSLIEITAISKQIPQCSLGTDDPTKKNIMTAYLVYIPFEESSYCIDSTGASMIIPNKPKGLSCVSGL